MNPKINLFKEQSSNNNGDPSIADNLISSYIKESKVFIDRPSIGGTVNSRPQLESVATIVSEPGVGFTGVEFTYFGHVAEITPAMQRLGKKASRADISLEDRQVLIEGGTRIDSVTMIGDGVSVDAFNLYRQGFNVKDIQHLRLKTGSPMVRLNSADIIDTAGRIDHFQENVNFGQGTHIKCYDDDTEKFIPFEDFPGRLDPVDYVRLGNYLLQYMIINDQVRDIDHFTDPASMDGIIEVFEIRSNDSVYNSSDIKIRGIKGTYSTGDWNFDQKGSSPVDTVFEKVQSTYDYFEDSADISLAHAVTSSIVNTERLTVSQDLVKHGLISQEGFISDGKYGLSPFNESSDTIANTLLFSLKNFLSANGVTLKTTGSVYNYAIESERPLEQIGTRYNSATTGFHFREHVVGAGESGIKTKLDMDTIAFGGLLK